MSSVSQSGSHVIAEVESTIAARRRRSDRWLLWLTLFAAVGIVVVIGGTAFVSYQIYSCTTTGHPCYERSRVEVQKNIGLLIREIEQNQRQLKALLEKQEGTP